MDSACLLANEVWLKQYLRAAKALTVNYDDVALWRSKIFSLSELSDVSFAFAEFSSNQLSCQSAFLVHHLLVERSLKGVAKFAPASLQVFSRSPENFASWPRAA